jgi:two-component system sensor histidine kinase AgrC
MIYIWNKNRYKDLNDSYNILFEYACLYEEELEKDKLTNHEYKNQLAVIKGLTKNKKVLNHIDQILENNKKADTINLHGLNNLPRGGLRGLFYYKISNIKKRNINFSIDISKSVTKSLSKLELEETKTLTYILGVFCDNALEESMKDKNSNISIEMYKIGGEIKIIVSNTIVGKINLNKIGEKGYSTKGNNRGNGLYLVKKLLKNDNKMSLSTKVINNYFVQELSIKNV